MSGHSILDLEGISRSFGGVKAVDGVSLSVKRGSITGLIGPNGSGKSTLFNIISGVEKKNSGAINFQGTRLDKLSPHKRFALGLGRTFQTPRLFTGMTVLENTMTGGKEQKGESPLNAPFPQIWEPQEMEIAKEAKSQMTSLEIEKLFGSHSNEISGGQMKLLQLSTVLMGRPKLLLLDEPTAGVAPRLAQDIFQSISQERVQNATTFFIIEHRLQVLFRHVDTVFVMHQGRIIASGKPDEIVKKQNVIDAYLGS
jgi:branched-chain amino acid transport system ATP-binding protein